MGRSPGGFVDGWWVGGVVVWARECSRRTVGITNVVLYCTICTVCTSSKAEAAGSRQGGGGPAGLDDPRTEIISCDYCVECSSSSKASTHFSLLGSIISVRENRFHIRSHIRPDTPHHTSLCDHTLLTAPNGLAQITVCHAPIVPYQITHAR